MASSGSNVLVMAPNFRPPPRYPDPSTAIPPPYIPPHRPAPIPPTASLPQGQPLLHLHHTHALKRSYQSHKRISNLQERKILSKTHPRPPPLNGKYAYPIWAHSSHSQRSRMNASTSRPQVPLRRALTWGKYTTTSARRTRIGEVPVGPPAVGSMAVRRAVRLLRGTGG